MKPETTTPTATPSAGEPVTEFDLLHDVVGSVERSGFKVRDSYTTRFNHLRNPPIPCIELHIVIAESEFKHSDPYPWLARGAIPPYQPPFPG